MALKFYKRIETKNHKKMLGANYCVCKSYRGKLEGGTFAITGLPCGVNVKFIYNEGFPIIF